MTAHHSGHLTQMITFCQTPYGEALLRKATQSNIYTVFISHHTLLSTPPLDLTNLLVSLKNSHGSLPFLLLFVPEAGMKFGSSMLSDFEYFKEPPQHVLDGLDKAAATVLDGLDRTSVLISCLNGPELDAKSVISLSPTHTKLSDFIELSSSTGTKFAVIGGLDLLTSIFDGVNKLHQDITQRCIDVIMMLHNQSGIKLAPGDTMKLLRLIFENSDKFPKIETDKVLNMLEKTMKPLKAATDYSPGSYVIPISSADGTADNFQDMVFNSDEPWKLLPAPLQKLCRFLCHVGAKIEPSYGAAILGIIAVIQSTVTNNGVINAVNAAGCNTLYALSFSALLMNPKKYESSSAPTSGDSSVKEKRLEKMSNVFTGVAFFLGTMLIFSNGLLKLPSAYAASGMVSCFVWLMSAALFGYL